ERLPLEMIEQHLRHLGTPNSLEHRPARRARYHGKRHAQRSIEARDETGRRASPNGIARADAEGYCRVAVRRRRTAGAAAARPFAPLLPMASASSLVTIVLSA